MNSKGGWTWLLYPMVGPIFVFVLSRLILLVTKNNEFEFIADKLSRDFVIIYVLCFLPLLFIGLCVAIYGAFFRIIPVWIPLLSAVVPFLLLLNMEFLPDAGEKNYGNDFIAIFVRFIFSRFFGLAVS